MMLDIPAEDRGLAKSYCNRFRVSRLWHAVIGAFALLLTLAAGQTQAAMSYDYYLLGSGADVTTATQGGLLLAGGGPDVDEAMQWLITNSGGGDIVVIRTSGSDGYNSYIAGLGDVDSVETIVFNEASAANDLTVYSKLLAADALFIAGGDQWEYYQFWNDSLVEAAIHQLADRNVPIGGTSAGLAILGQFMFSAENGTVYSDEMLADPFNQYATLRHDFLTLAPLQNTITDTHFSDRNRMGRLIGFLCRLVVDGTASHPQAIAVDEGTAVLVGADHTVQVVGVASAYLLTSPGVPERCQPNQLLTYRFVPGVVLQAGDAFDLVSWTGDGEQIWVSAENETVTYAAPTAVEGVLFSAEGGQHFSIVASIIFSILMALTTMICRDDAGVGEPS